MRNYKRMKKVTIFFIIIYAFANIINAQNVIISGNARTYAGDEFHWKTYSDQLTFTETLLSTGKVDNKGNFKFTLNIDKPTISFIHLNVFKGILYIEPGKSYNIVLPKKVVKIPADELNPYFEETEFFVRCTNTDSTDLNYLIKKFDH